MINILVTIALVMGGLYALLMLLYLMGWLLQKNTRIPQNYQPATSLSIIIPARNESANMRACIESIIAQQYPANLYEIIVVDDFSEDDTVRIVRDFGAPNIRVVLLADIITDRAALTAFKKRALQAGIDHSTGEVIVTTDADCIAQPKWLLHIAYSFEQHAFKMLIGPVAFTSNGSLVQTFQALDFRTMQGITGAAHRLKLGNMANGANLAFSRQAFNEINGYEGTTHLASGDDYLLLVKMANRFPKGIKYLKSRDAIIATAPQPTWTALLNQRIRWASKSGKYKDHRLTAILMIVYLFNVLLLILGILCLLEPQVLFPFLILFGGKIILELVFLLPVSRFFGRGADLLMFPLLEPLHIIYISLAGFLGMMGSYEWKGRKVK